jgi:cob(I)alamin adenosyltransferase
MKIYTKTGDDGETGLFGGKRVSKDSLRIEAYGTLDELNSFLGLAQTCTTADRAKEIISWLQDILFVAGAELASPDEDSWKSLIPHIGVKDVIKPEQFIDELSESLEEIKNFILPGGTRSASILHVARSVSRRAERLIVALQKGEQINKNLLIFMNRISDLLFVLARYENHAANIKDVAWKSPRG